MIDTARIAKNTVFFYLRMILVLAASFLAVRALLDVLGVEDCGLFNLIVGFVTLFTLLMLFVGCTSSERAYLHHKLAAKLHRKENKTP